MHRPWARYLVVVPRPMPAAPRRYLIVAARRLPAAVVCHRYLIVVPRPLPAAPFLERRTYLTLDRSAEAVAHGAARCASHVLDRGAQAGAQTAACGDATLPHQEKNTRQMSTSGART
jgi:hypothetical protein